MRNILFLALASICLGSCTKVYECKCEDEGRIINKENEVFSISSARKSDAKHRCEEYEQKLYVNGYEYSCDID